MRKSYIATGAVLLGVAALALALHTRSSSVAVVGGLIVSQALPLFTAPVTYLYMDRFSEFTSRHLGRKKGQPSQKPQAEEASRDAA
jgi:hypothetical protein